MAWLGPTLRCAQPFLYVLDNGRFKSSFRRGRVFVHSFSTLLRDLPRHSGSIIVAKSWVITPTPRETSDFCVVSRGNLAKSICPVEIQVPWGSTILGRW